VPPKDFAEALKELEEIVGQIEGGKWGWKKVWRSMREGAF
jgi:exonuclease VII small subunit